MKVLDAEVAERLLLASIELREGDVLKFVKELVILRGQNYED